MSMAFRSSGKLLFYSRKWELNNPLPIDLSEKKSLVPQRLQKPVCLAKRVAPLFTLKLERAE